MANKTQTTEYRWLADWIERNTPVSIRPNDQETWGMTQLRFAEHALKDRFRPEAFADALPLKEGGNSLPALVNLETQDAIIFPGAFHSLLPREYDPTTHWARIDCLPGADIQCFQHLANTAVINPEFRAWYTDIHEKPLPTGRPTSDAFSGNQALSELRNSLEWFYGSDESLGVYQDPDLEIALLPNGEEFGRCTNSARMIAETFGGTVFGFHAQDNIQSTHETIEQAGGHDFAVINGRYIVDLWVSVYAHGQTKDGHRLPIVYDLESDDPQEQALNVELFGDPNTWEMVESYPTPNTLKETDMTEQITIDLTPYNVTHQDNHLTIHDCAGSILANLANDPQATGNRFSDDCRFGVLENEEGELRAAHIHYDRDDESLSISARDGEPVSLEEAEKWIAENFDRIETIAYETLLDDEELEEALSRHRALSPI